MHCYCHVKGHQLWYHRHIQTILYISVAFFKRKKKEKTKYIVKMASIWTNRFYIFMEPCKKYHIFPMHNCLSLTTEQFSHLNKLYIVKLIVADCIIDCIVYYIKCEFVPPHFKRSLCSTAYFRLLGIGKGVLVCRILNPPFLDWFYEDIRLCSYYQAQDSWF